MVLYYRSSPCHSVWGNHFFVRPHCYQRTFLVHPSDTDQKDTEEINAKTENKAHESTEDKPSESLLYRGRNFQLVEKGTCYEFQLDLPGVKSSDLTIKVLDDGFLHIQGTRTNGGRCNSEIDRKYAFDESSIDATKIQANLVDGVLNIVLPKKAEEAPAEPHDISVTAGHSNQNDSSNKKVVFTVDLPGVPADRIQLSYHEEKVTLQAERLREGEVVSKINRMIFINTKKVDAIGLEGFLADGVLELVAPEKQPVEPILVPITTNAVTEKPLHVEQSVEAEEDIHVEPSSDDEKDESVQASVETVSEEEAAEDEEEADGWHKTF